MIVQLLKSDDRDKRFIDILDNNSAIYSIGDAKYPTYTLHTDQGLYIVRHQTRGNWKDIFTHQVSGVLGGFHGISRQSLRVSETQDSVLELKIIDKTSY